MSKSIRSAVGKIIQNVSETADAYIFGLSDGSQARVPRGPLLDCREIIDKWNRLWTAHIRETVPPAHQGWGILDFGDGGQSPTTCSGVLRNRGILKVAKDFMKIKITAKAGLNQSALPSGAKFTVKSKGTIQVMTGSMTVTEVTSPEQAIDITGDPGTVVQLQTTLNFTYTVPNDTTPRQGSVPVTGYVSIPSSVGTGEIPAVNLYGTAQIDNSRVSATRTTNAGQVTTNTSSSMIPSKVTIGTDSYEWLAGQDETKVFDIPDPAKETEVLYDFALGVVASYSYCEYAKPVYPPAGTFIKNFCSSELVPNTFDYMKRVADGNGGYIDTVEEANSTKCGYVPPAANDCKLSQSLVQVALRQGEAVTDQQLVTFSDYNGTPIVQLASGTLPPNLSVSIKGTAVVLNGTPMQSGPVNAVFNVSASGCTKQFALRGDITPPPASNPNVQVTLSGQTQGTIQAANATNQLPFALTATQFPPNTPITVKQTLQNTATQETGQEIINAGTTTSTGSLAYTGNVKPTNYQDRKSVV